MAAVRAAACRWFLDGACGGAVDGALCASPQPSGGMALRRTRLERDGFVGLAAVRAHDRPFRPCPSVGPASADPHATRDPPLCSLPTPPRPLRSSGFDQSREARLHYVE